MSPLPEDSPSHWRAACLLGFFSLFSFLYFYEGGGWNQNSRFDLLRAIVEEHTLRIDDYHENTQDKAHFQGHYYSDKAPGLVFLAVPFAMVARPALRIAGVDPRSPRGELALSYVVSACAVALPTAVAVVCLFFLGLRFGGSIAGAAFGAATMGLGTPMWAYASLFWAHALVAACLIFAFAAALKVRDSSGARADFLWALAVGLAAGWATVTEYPAAPASAMLALLAVSQVWPRGKAARWRVMAGVSLGAAICLVVLLWYLHAAFGSFRPSYSYYDPNAFAFMQQRGYLGLTYPHPDRLLKLLFGCSRGLFFASPVALAAPVGLWWLWKENAASRGCARRPRRLRFITFCSMRLFTGGRRDCGLVRAMRALAFRCCVLAWLWRGDGLRPAWRRVLIGLALCSVFLALMVVSTTSQLSMQDNCPIAHSVGQRSGRDRWR